MDDEKPARAGVTTGPTADEDVSSAAVRRTPLRLVTWNLNHWRQPLLPADTRRAAWAHLTSTWLVDRAARGKREDFTYPPELPDGALPTLDAAVEKAREVALRRLLEKQAELSIANRERLGVERAKLERYYDYRQRAAEDKVEAVRATFERLSASEEPDVIRIVPVWAKNLEHAKRTVELVAADRRKRLDGLARHEDVSAQHELLTASYVQIVPEPVDDVPQ